MKRYAVFTFSLLVLFGLAGGCAGNDGWQWYKGNTHTHSLWSDGDAAPELVADWYRSNDYNFLVLTDHDILLEGGKWFTVSKEAGGRLTEEHVGDLKARFGDDWVVTRENEGKTEMKLKTHAELLERFGVPGEFGFIQGEEISDSFEGKPLHFCALGINELIPVQRGESLKETIRRNVGAVLEQERRVGRPIVAQVNHTNWRWALTPEELAAVEGTNLFEVYNGSTGCNNFGDELHPGMDEVWDIALTIRLTELGLDLLFGIATDDTHDFLRFGPGYSNPGRGWIMVRSERPTQETILEAMRAGDFYSSTGVELKDFKWSRSRYFVAVEEEEGVTYKVRFIGTRMVDGRPGEIGEIFLETGNNPAVYRFQGDELYVRAKVISSRMQANHAEGEEAPEVAWLQPMVPPVGY